MQPWLPSSWLTRITGTRQPQMQAFDFIFACSN
jgi:hypothetical protein